MIPKAATDIFKPKPEHIFIVGFSGGKDSLAVLLYLIYVLKAKRVIAVFADTNHESQITYDYIETLKLEYGLPITTVTATLGEFADEKELAVVNILLRLDLVAEPCKTHLSRTLELAAEAKVSKDKPRAKVHLERIKQLITEAESLGLTWRDEPLTMERLAILKRRFPSPMLRFCTTFLKLMPQRNWVTRYLKTLDAADVSRVIRVSGVRAQESSKRAKHPTAQFDDYMGCWLWLPIHKWTHEDVFEIAKKYEIPVNPLYKMGYGRVGCFPCINATKSELRSMATRHPETLVQLRGMEERAADAVGKKAMSFFSNDKTPTRFHSHVCENSGKSFPDAMDVMRWALNLPSNPNQGLLFSEDDNEDSHSCSSKYGLCE